MRRRNTSASAKSKKVNSYRVELKKWRQVERIEIKLSEIGRLAVHGLAKLPGSTGAGIMKQGDITFARPCTVYSNFRENDFVAKALNWGPDSLVM